jgi:signal transduction histidine kinase
VCFAAFLLTNVLFVTVFKKLRRLHIFALCVPIILFVAINSYAVKPALYQFAVSFNPRLTQKGYIAAQNVLIAAIMLFYTLFPFYHLLRTYFGQMLDIKKKYAVIGGVCLCLINLLVYFTFVFGTLRDIFLTNVNFIGYPNSISDSPAYATTSVLFISILMLIIILILYYRPYKLFALSGRHKTIKDSMMYSNNTIMLLHTYKNALLGIRRFNQLAADEPGVSGAAAAYLTRSRDIAQEQLDAIDRSVKMLRGIKASIDAIDLIGCAEAAIRQLGGLPGITLIRKYAAGEIYIYGDEYHMKEAFVNIFTNAAEAIETAAPEEPQIKIVAELDLDFCIITITDNGCGIDKGVIKHIFKEFFSTKSRIISGVGLSYVNNVVSCFNGEIHVSSEPEKYTAVQLLFPRMKNGKQERV